jgi:hypothetical protein
MGFLGFEDIIFGACRRARGPCSHGELYGALAGTQERTHEMLVDWLVTARDRDSERSHEEARA